MFLSLVRQHYVTPHDIRGCDVVVVQGQIMT
jgi:hypothetical protein